MTAAQFDITMEQDSTWRLVLRLPTLDLTGCTALMQIRTEAGAAGDPLYELSTDNGKIVIDPAAHTITLKAPDEDTAAMGWRYGRYDLLLEPPDGEGLRLLKGAVQVDRTVSRT